MFKPTITAARPLPFANLAAGWMPLAPRLRSALRIVAAFMFIQFGTMKLFAFPMGMPPDGGAAPLFSQMGLAGVLETFGGALLLLGLFTRPVAFVLSGEMAVAYFLVSAPLGFWTIINGGTVTVLFCFLWLYFSAAGAGPWSLDALWRTEPAGSDGPGGLHSIPRHRGVAIANEETDG